MSDEIDGNQEVCQRETCEYGVLLAEELLLLGNQLGAGTEIVLYNAVGISGSLDKGIVTFDDMARAHAWGNSFAAANLTGKTVTEVIGHMLYMRGKDGGDGSFLQIAGIRYQAVWSDVVRTYVLGQIEARNVDGTWSELCQTRQYSVIMNRWSLRGGEGFSMLIGMPYQVLGTTRAAMMAKFQREEAVGAPAIDDRICETSCSWLDSGDKIPIACPETV